MRIEFSLEPRDKNDPKDIDPVGNITLIGDEKVLNEQYVYVDSWLNALHEGSQKLRENNHVEIDLIEEPNPLIFEMRSDGYINISFKGRSIAVNNAQTIENAVDLAKKKLSELT